MSRKIAYIGFGALGKQVSAFIRQTSSETPEEIYFDDVAVKNGLANAYPFSEHAENSFSEYDFYICLGYKQLSIKNDILNKLKSSGRNLPAFIHPSTIVNPDSKIGPGCIIYPGCNIDQGVILKEAVLLNNSVTICHDSIIHNSTFLAPAVVICGNVIVEEECFIGAGTVVLNEIEIGKGATIGAGSLVSMNIPPKMSAIGNPIRLLNSQIELH